MSRPSCHHVGVSQLVDLFDRAVMGFVNHVPGWAVGAAAIVFYPILGLIVPFSLKWSLTEFLYANAVGVCVAAILTIGWLSAQIEGARRRHLVEWTTDLRLLDAEEIRVQGLTAVVDLGGRGRAVLGEPLGDLAGES